MKTTNIPNHVDDSHQILFWDIEEIAVASIIFIAGYVMRELTIAIVFSFIVVYFFSSWKTNQHIGVLIHMTYQKGLYRLNDVFINGNTKGWHH